MRIGVIGINYRHADLKFREAFAKVCQQRFASYKSTPIDHSTVLLSTCNRTEVYFCSNDLPLTHSLILNLLRDDLALFKEHFDQKLYSYFGHDCFKHLARVTAGLDSAIIAETEIQGQVKAAYENSLKHLDLPKELHYLFQKSLKIGKQIRTDLPMERGLPDIEQAVLAAGYQLLNNLEHARILFVGASDINCKILAFFKAKNFHQITLCNRSPDSAQAIARQFQIPILDWCQLNNWYSFDMVIFGTKSPEPLITKRDLPPVLTQPKLLIDLSVPRNVDSKLARVPSISLLNIDQINRTLINRRDWLHDLLLKAEALVEHATKKQFELFQQKDSLCRPLRIAS